MSILPSPLSHPLTYSRWEGGSPKHRLESPQTEPSPPMGSQSPLLLLKTVPIAGSQIPRVPIQGTRTQLFLKKLLNPSLLPLSALPSRLQ